MTIRVGINGFGRIGRNVLRAIIESKRKDIKVVAINNRSSLHVCAHLLKYDSVHGVFPYEISASDNTINVGDESIFVSNELTIEGIPWHKNDVDLVMECTGKFNNADECRKHIDGGAKRVLISAPAKDADLTVVYGVNEKKINSRLVKLDESKRVKNYVYRLISEKRYKKLVNLKEIYKFSDIE